MIYDQAYDLCNMQSKIEFHIINYHVFVSILAFVIEALHEYSLRWQVFVVARWLDRWVANKINGEHKFVFIIIHEADKLPVYHCFSTGLDDLYIIYTQGQWLRPFCDAITQFQCTATKMVTTLYGILLTSFLGFKQHAWFIHLLNVVYSTTGCNTHFLLL